MDAFWAAPPVIRTIVASTIVLSVLIRGQLISAYNFVFLPEFLVAKFPPQIWRLATSFWLTRPQMALILDPYFLWQYGSALEGSSPRFARKGDFFVYVVFVKAIILMISGVFLGDVAFIGPLILAFAYSFAQDNPNHQISFFIITVRAIYLPYILLAWDFVSAGPVGVYMNISGLIAAHAYDFLTKIWPTYGGGTNWIEWATPAFVRGLFGEGAVRPGIPERRGYGSAYKPADQRPSQGRSTGVNSPFVGGGTRLGGNDGR